MSISHLVPSMHPPIENVLADSSPFAPRVDPVLAIVEWLSSNECHELDDAGLIAGLGRRLRAAGLPVDRLSLHLRAFHPEILGRTLAWAPNEPVEIHDRQHGAGTALADDPLGQATEIREPLAVYRADRGDEAWTRIDVFQGRYLAELVAVRFHNAEGPVSAAMF